MFAVFSALHGSVVPHWPRGGLLSELAAGALHCFCMGFGGYLAHVSSTDAPQQQRILAHSCLSLRGFCVVRPQLLYGLQWMCALCMGVCLHTLAAQAGAARTWQELQPVVRLHQRLSESLDAAQVCG